MAERRDSSAPADKAIDVRKMKVDELRKGSPGVVWTRKETRQTYRAGSTTHSTSPSKPTSAVCEQQQSR